MSAKASRKLQLANKLTLPSGWCKFYQLKPKDTLTVYEGQVLVVKPDHLILSTAKIQALKELLA